MTFEFERPERFVNKMFWHCSASDIPDHDNVETIMQWHVVERGWSAIGYHWVITKDGVIHPCRSLEVQPAAQKPFNEDSLAGCVTGHRQFSIEQMRSVIDLSVAIDNAYPDGITFHGHNEVANKACPVFDYREVLRLDGDGRMFRHISKGE